MKQTSRGIFIHKTAFADNSLIVYFFTENMGLQHFMFYGGKKKSAVLFPCSLCELSFYKHPGSELAKLVKAEPLISWQKTPYHPVHATVAVFFADIMRNVLKGEQGNQALFEFLLSYIKKIDGLNENELQMGVLYFLLKLTVFLGIEPKAEVIPKKFFVPHEGIFTDSDPSDGRSLSGGGVFLIQCLLNEREIQYTTSSDKREALHALLVHYQQHYAGFNVERTLEVIREILYL